MRCNAEKMGRELPIARSTGFTLIELLVVIAIIALLMALLTAGAVPRPQTGAGDSLSNQAETMGDDPGPVCPGQ